MKTRIGILGYGNLGKGVELAVTNSSDMELVGIFTRRDNVNTKSGNAHNIKDIAKFTDKIDVMILCGGSATDLPTQGLEMAKLFNTVDSFDTHAKIPTYFADMEKIAKDNNHLSAISIGWDPGLFSINRAMFESVLPHGESYTFWGKGVSQGHSDAIRRIEGVADARQYTIPVDKAVELVLSGVNPTLTTREKHLRECFVVAKEGADLEKITSEIVNMPNYFSDYDTTVNFITQEELNEKHYGIPHGGKVIRGGDTYSDNVHVLEFGLKLDSNPEFTASVLVAYARAVHAMRSEGQTGCVTILDVPVSKLSPKSHTQLITELL